jgi:hypothetical protein
MLNDIDYESLPSGKWVKIGYKENTHCLKQKDAFAIIYPNVSSFGTVSEWQSECYRLPSKSAIRIDARTIKGSNLEECKAFLEEEMGYLLSIGVPERDFPVKKVFVPYTQGE